MKNNNLSELTAISPIDGRYRGKTKVLSEFTSEYALIKERINVEIKYLLFLSEKKIVRKVSPKEKEILEKIVTNFSIKDANTVKEIEKATRHDLKAVEYFLRLHFEKTSLRDLVEFIHFGLTSEDINNLSLRLLLKDANGKVIVFEIENLTGILLQKAKAYKNAVIIGRTHGQNAVPTTFGKEILVFKDRIEKQNKKLKDFEFEGKLNGAVGNFNALHFVLPKVDWEILSKEFIKSLDLSPILLTTQVNPNDDLVEYFQIIERINLIINDLNADMWRYVSDTWLVQENNSDEVGSSTMPQKINPIDFENSEGNIAVANGLIDVFVKKLPISRLQRDLSNSTVLRNLGSVLAYCLISYQSCEKGLSRISPNPKLRSYVTKDWSILSEAAQTLLRKEGILHPYKLLSELTKGRVLTQEDWLKVVEKLPISEENKQKLSKLTPQTYRGIY